MNKVLITGGLGFIGTNLIPGMLDAGVSQITVFDNMSNVSGDQVDDEKVRVIEGDIRNYEQLKSALYGHDTVVHLAAHTRVIDSIADPRLNFDINTQGTFNVLEAMRTVGCKNIINASTGGAIIGEAVPPVNEQMVPMPSSPYGASKLSAEGYCSAYSDSYDINATSLRFSNLYGPHSLNKGSVVAAFIKGIRDHGRIIIYGDGEQTRDYLYIDDLVKGIIDVALKGLRGVYQLGYGKPTSLNEVVDIFRKTLPLEFTVEYQDYRQGEIKHTYCDISKARNAFDFNPQTTLEQGVYNTWRWFEDNA